MRNARALPIARSLPVSLALAVTALATSALATEPLQLAVEPSAPQPAARAPGSALAPVSAHALAPTSSGAVLAVVGGERRGGNLVVPEHPEGRADDPTKRLRTHVEGALVKHETRRWVGPVVPSFVELIVGAQELFLLDETPDGHFALYREPYGAERCGLTNMWVNCGFTLRLYGRDGAVRTLPLNPLLTRDSHLEVQDVQYSGGLVYFNEACQTYASDAKGQCSSLVALDLANGKIIWRTKPLVSNSRFTLAGDLILTGYGFTAEPDFLYLVDRATGRVLDRMKVKTAPETYEPAGLETWRVTLYDASQITVRIDRPSGRPPRLVLAPDPAPVQKFD